MKLTTHPVTLNLWPALEDLCGPKRLQRLSVHVLENWPEGCQTPAGEKSGGILRDCGARDYPDRQRHTGDLRGQAPILWTATALMR